MKDTILDYKEAYKIKIISKLNELEQKIKPLSKKKYIPFADVFQKIGSSCALNKKEIWQWLFILDEDGDIDIIFSKGIILNPKLKRLKVGI